MVPPLRSPSSSPPAPTPAPLPELEEQLTHFRREWIEENRRRALHEPATAPSTAAPAPPIASTSSNSQQATATTGTSTLRHARDDSKDGIEDQLAAVGLEDKWKPHKPKSALEVYAVAVQAEREGRLNDALASYRKAFRMDPDVDRAYHHALQAPSGSSSSRAVEPPPTVAPGEFKFERTIQMHADYDDKDHHRSVEDVVEATEREEGAAATEGLTHPSSTDFLRQSLLKSIGENPYVRPTPTLDPATTAVEEQAPPPPKLSPEEAEAQLTFIPEDPEQPLYLSILPREVLLLILRALALSSVIPPPRSNHPPHGEEAPVPTTRGKRQPKKRTIKEETANLEMEMEIGEETKHVQRWKTDVEAVERFARTCRAARILTLDAGLWRSLCHQTYLRPHQTLDPPSLLLAHHSSDWRRCYIEHPRLRLDGVYIAVVTYVRRGSAEAWYAPQHVVTFYRFLRFYANGIVISLLTTDTPQSLVKGLNLTMRMKGLGFGRWRLRGDQVEIWGLEDPSIERERRKYAFRMTLRLKSSTRGKMNKLEMLTLATEHRQTLELTPVPIKPTKPFFFSKVASYAADDLE